MSNMNMLITRASRFHAAGDFRARSRLSRVIFAMSSRILSGIIADFHIVRGWERVLSPPDKFARC